MILVSPHGSAELHEHGATLTSWQPADQPPVIFTSAHAVFDGKAPIRGGVPLCFPWFSAHPSDPTQPAHGLVRTARWQPHPYDPTHESGNARLTLDLPPFALTLAVALGDATLHLHFSARNLTDQTQRYELALHTYLHLSDIHRVSITGLETCDYLDNLQNRQRVNATDDPLVFTGETDRVYLDTPEVVTLRDPGFNRAIEVRQNDSPHHGTGRTTVVWNPWIEKSKRLADLGDDEWPRFCCIESSHVAEHAITLPPGEEHTTEVTLTVRGL